MFAVIHLPDFALQAALRHEPELWGKPVALVDPAMSTPRVVQLTEAARVAGVAEGLTPTQALARCRDVTIRRRSATQETAAIEAVLQCAYGFSPNIEDTAPGTVTLDLRGLAALGPACRRDGSAAAAGERDASAFNREAMAVWAGRLRTALAALNLRARIGAGPTPNVARHAARWSDGIEIVAAPQEFIAALPVAALEPSSDVALIFQKWGLRTVGEVLALGQEALSERIGLEALALFAAASTSAMRPLKIAEPPEKFEESFDFEPPVETVEPLLFILRRFVDQLSQRLELAGLVAEMLTLRFRLESDATLERRLRVPQPTRQPEILFRMLHTHLDTVRTDSPIVRVGLHAEPTQPEQKQFSLFDAALRDPHQFQETLARLSALVGADRVGTPLRENSHRPDAFKLIPPDFENAPSAIGRCVAEILRAAPLRKFRPPLPAQVECDGEPVGQPPPGPGDATAPSPSPSSPPVAARGVQAAPPPLSIRCSVTKGKLKVVIGPWRASGRWWEGGGWQREEWDVATRDGKALRLVQRPEGWFVEGMMD